MSVRIKTLLLLLQLFGLAAVWCLPADEEHRRPQLTDRIAIVGAGPSGLHMAYLLRSLGFEHLLLLEASGRVGGRSLTFRFGVDEVPHELGTCYVSSDYAELRRMAKNIGYDLNEALLPAAVVRKSAALAGDQTDLQQFVFDRVRQLDPAVPPDASIPAILSQIESARYRYKQLRSEIFPASQPDYLEFPLNQPSAEAMSRLNCSLLTYLERNSLLALEPFFLLGMAAMGYGSPGDTSALYGLMWMTPAYLGDLLDKREKSKLGMLRDGFQAFWEAARDKLLLAGKVQLRTNSRVKSVKRVHTGRGRPVVTIKLADNRTEVVNWLVWTPSVKTIVDAELFEDLTPEETEVFAKSKSRLFRTKLVRLSGRPAVAADPVAYYLDQLDTESPDLNRLLAVRNTNLALNASDSSSADFSTLVAYYLSGYDEDSDKESGEANPGLTDPLADGKVLAHVTFGYMPRYSIADMASGVLWRLLRDIQGARGTWFAGHSVSFDSVKSVMKYNKMLLLHSFPEWEERLKDL